MNWNTACRRLKLQLYQQHIISEICNVTLSCRHTASIYSECIHVNSRVQVITKLKDGRYQYVSVRKRNRRGTLKKRQSFRTLAVSQHNAKKKWVTWQVLAREAVMLQIMTYAATKQMEQRFSRQRSQATKIQADAMLQRSLSLTIIASWSRLSDARCTRVYRTLQNKTRCDDWRLIKSSAKKRRDQQNSQTSRSNSADIRWLRHSEEHISATRKPWSTRRLTNEYTRTLCGRKISRIVYWQECEANPRRKKLCNGVCHTLQRTVTKIVI